MPLAGKFNALNQLLEDGWPVIITFAVILLLVYWPRVAARIERRWFGR